jgi:hypothetical protein
MLQALSLNMQPAADQPSKLLEQPFPLLDAITLGVTVTVAVVRRRLRIFQRNARCCDFAFSALDLSCKIGNQVNSPDYRLSD